jgi:threonine dehydratase
MPLTTPEIKVQAVADLGAEIVLHGDDYDGAYEHAVELARERGVVFVHPFDDPDVIAGQGTVAMEILRQQHGDDIDAIFVPVGGGGLISGIAAYVKALYPRIKIIGVEPEDAAGMYESLRAGKRVTLERVGMFADGVAVRRVGEETFRLARQYVDEIILVTTDQLCAAIQDIFEDTRSIVEPLGRFGGGRHQEIRGARRLHAAQVHCHQRRRQYEFRPAALRRRARRHRRAARIVRRWKFPKRPVPS